ncbi:MAG: hypothetical protein PHS41_01675 [Victivallaceae bacterium]|nr:hypothetical protein [Victivallaceae bacterium]
MREFAVDVIFIAAADVSGCAGEFAKRCCCADVVVMPVGMQNMPNVARAKTQRHDRIDQQIKGLGHSRVDQDDSVVGVQQP